MPHDPTPSFLSPKLELRPCPAKGGYGLFARQPISSGELLCAWGGEVMTEDELATQPPERQQHGIQIEDQLYLVPLVDDDPADFVNHSCNPNAGLSGQICLVAMRPIEREEEICFDYAMSDSSDYDEFECHCGSPGCRRRITGSDWKLPELQKRYAGYFMPYLQRRINGLTQK